MSTDKRVVVNISKQAVVKIEAFGYVGPACLKMIEPIQNALGVATTVESKPEFFAQEQAHAFA